MQSFALSQQATIENTRRDHSTIACSGHLYMVVVLRASGVAKGAAWAPVAL